MGIQTLSSTSAIAAIQPATLRTDITEQSTPVSFDTSMPQVSYWIAGLTQGFNPVSLDDYQPPDNGGPGSSVGTGSRLL
jgi:hypothetical protein